MGNSKDRVRNWECGMRSWQVGDRCSVLGTFGGHGHHSPSARILRAYFSLEAWNTVLFEKCTRFRHLFVEGYSRHSDEYLKRSPYPLGSKVLDVGCGWGDTTIKIAETVGSDGKAFGVDCAENYIGICNERAVIGDE